MATHNLPDDELNRPTDPAQLGSDQGSVSRPEDDPRDMSTVVANAGDYRDGAGPRNQEPDPAFRDSRPVAGQGSDFDQQRRQGAGDSDDHYGAVGRGYGMGHAGFNGDEDRGYDQSGYRGGLGTSGGREDLSDRQFNPDQNPFTGGYGGGDYDQPTGSITQRIGLNSRNPTDESNPRPDDNLPKAGTETT